LFHVIQLMKLINLIRHTKTAVSPTGSYKEKSFKKVMVNYRRNLYKPITSTRFSVKKKQGVNTDGNVLMPTNNSLISI